jgi:hypothetical protein
MTQAETVEAMSPEYKAFSKMLQSRTSIWEDSVMLFRLYNLNMPLSTSDLVVEDSGVFFLCMDCLKNVK